MASNAFRAALAATKATKSMDQVLIGSGSNYLGEGEGIEVTLTAIGPATDRQGNAVDNQYSITYTSDDGKSFTDRLFLTNNDGTELGFGVRRLLSALIPDTALLEQWFDIAVNDDHALAMFTGMKCSIDLATRGTKDGSQFTVRSTGSGGFAAFQINEKGEVGEALTEVYAELKDARDAAKAAGYKQAFLKITRMQATHAESNAAAFATAVAGRSKAKPAVKPGVRVTKAV